jgi:hypothetical protein
MDNAYVNKGYTVIALMVTLVLLGICRKVKISFMVVGHTHDDYDALIATICTHISNMDIFTLAAFEQACRDAILKENCQVIDVLQLFGLPDFDRFFQDSFKGKKPEGIKFLL